MVTIHKNGKIVSKSKNLRGVLDYARKHGVKQADAFEFSHSLGASGGTLVVMFQDQAWAITDFADYSVLTRWIAARKSW